MTFNLIQKTVRLALLLLCALIPTAHASEIAWLDTMDLSHMRQGYGSPVTNAAVNTAPILLASHSFERGVGTHARSTLWIEPNGASQFEASVGISDRAGGAGTVVFRVIADGKKLYDSGPMKVGMVKKLKVSLSGAHRLLLLVGDAGDGNKFDHAVWAEARFTYEGTPPRAIDAPVEPARILTPLPKPAPRINGPTIYGCRPGNPFLYRIPAQGERPMRFSASDLPKTLRLDANTGIITGKSPERGIYDVRLRAKNRRGKDERRLRIVSGDKLSLTPSMGWNHWYAHYNRITQPMMMEAADLLVSSGMADVGYQYVNIDDCWMNAEKVSDPVRVGPLRDRQGRIIPNKYFPDMKGLADYIHSKGLKAGLYSSPGPETCAGYAGSFNHEAIDAATFSEWGFDFLKYDWCSYQKVITGVVPSGDQVPTIPRGNDVMEIYEYPFRLMGGLLEKQPRDILFNLCQYGMKGVWEWGVDVDAQSWRTAGDLGYQLDRVFEVALKNSEHRAWSAPGAWNDPDYIQIGWIGQAQGLKLPAPCQMPPNEQYAFMSLWALMASPLFYSGDMTRLDAFTLNVLCNPEVIAINQDALGQSAAVASLGEDAFMMVKDLEDGSKAIGLFNEGEFPAELKLPWGALGLRGPMTLRDAWRQKDIGEFAGDRSFKVPARGCVLVTARKTR